MYRIAICDDSEQDRDSVKQALTQIQIKWNIEFSTTYFSCGEDLCEDIKKNTYEIILLDIMMDGIDGIKTAKNIRSYGEDSKIIFISSCDDRIRELFDVNAVTFLDKPINKDDLEQYLDKCLNIIKNTKNDKVFSYSKNKSLMYVDIEDIVYFESDRNHITICTVKEKIQYVGQLKNVWDTVSIYDDFIKPNQSNIFNLKYVDVLSNKIQIKSSKLSVSIDQIEINIGRVFKTDTLNRYMNYIEKRGG